MTNDSTHAVTSLLQRFSRGEEGVADELLLAIYDELTALARGQMRKEGPGHTLQPTALVHELWAKLLSMDSVPNWPSRGHFYKWTSKAMGNLLRDHARRKNSWKAGGNHVLVTLEGSDLVPDPTSSQRVLEVLDAIEEFCRIDPERGSAVELRVFVGLSYREIAEVQNLTESRVDRSLQVARAWLKTKLEV